MVEQEVKERPQIKLNGSVFEVYIETSGSGFWYRVSTPAAPRELPKKVYLFQLYGDNGNRKVIAFDTPTSDRATRDELTEILRTW